MAYDGSKFARLSAGGNSNIAQIYGYSTNDTLATVLGANYFADAVTDSQMKPMDVLFCRYDEDGTPGQVQLVVTATGAGTASVGQAASEGGGVWISTQVAALGTAGSVYIAAPFAGSIRRFKVTIQGAIDADETVTLKLATVAVTGGVVTIESDSSAAGDVGESTATALNGVTAGQAVEIVTAGTSNGGLAIYEVEFVPAVVVEHTNWICGTIADVSTPGSVYVAAPFAGTIRKWKTVLQAIGSFGATACTLKLQLGGSTDVTGSDITISAAGEAVGDVDEATCTAENTVTAGQAVEVVTAGESSGTCPVFFMIEFVPS